MPIIVVLGIDVDGKPHASRFEERDAQFVQRAAELIGFHVIRVGPETEELHAVAEGLPVGKSLPPGAPSCRLSAAPRSTSSQRWWKVG